MRVQHSATVERFGKRVDGEVAQSEVVDDRRTTNRRQVDLPRPVGTDHAPCPELLAERERGTPGLEREATGRSLDITLEDDVYVPHVAAHDPVTDRAADDPRGLLAQRGAGGVECGAHG